MQNADLEWVTMNERLTLMSMLMMDLIESEVEFPINVATVPSIVLVVRPDDSIAGM
jgi:hypothetical protein